METGNVNNVLKGMNVMENKSNTVLLELKVIMVLVINAMILNMLLKIIKLAGNAKNVLKNLFVMVHKLYNVNKDLI